MPRVVGVTETGSRQLVVGSVRRWLHVLREDLCTLRVEPLPPSVWLRWLPHGVLCMVAVGVTVGAVAQLMDNGGVGSSLPSRSVSHRVPPSCSRCGGRSRRGGSRPWPWWSVPLRSAASCWPAARTTSPGPGAPQVIEHMAVLLLLALRVPMRVAVEALAVTLLLTYLIEGVLGAADFQPTGVLAVILFTVVVVLGTALRGRREASKALVEQTTLTAEERARRTLLEERSRIARELHDVVAHHMSVISIQAQVAPHLVENPSVELRENLDGIRQNALEALTELRRVLGVLRAEHPETPERPADPATGTAPHAPQPTLDRLDALVENTRAAGTAVEVDVRGARRPLPPGVDLSAYRIVQEALSNVLRHAPGATASVALVHYVHGVDVRIVNSRPTRSVPSSPGAGHGLLGMRERAAMLGGTLRAGPRPDGGYEVAAYLPTAPPGAPDQLTDPKDDTA